MALAVLAAPRADAGPAGVGPSSRRAPAASTATTSADTDDGERPPGTTLEADERDDGGTNAATWFVGSGIAAAVAVGAGGMVLKRRAR